MTHVRKLTMRDTKGLQSEVTFSNNGCPPNNPIDDDAILRIFRFSDVAVTFVRGNSQSRVSSDMLMWFGNFSNPVCENVELKVAKLTGFFLSMPACIVRLKPYVHKCRILYQAWKHYPVEFLTIFSVLTKILWNQHFHAHKN